MCDVFYKETDTREYLPFDSCHVRHCKINIPYNLCRTVCTIVEDKDILQKRLDELKLSLIKAKYPIDIIISAITKAKNVPQEKLCTQKLKIDFQRCKHESSHAKTYILYSSISYRDYVKVKSYYTVKLF